MIEPFCHQLVEIGFFVMDPMSCRWLKSRRSSRPFAPALSRKRPKELVVVQQPGPPVTELYVVARASLIPWVVEGS